MADSKKRPRAEERLEVVVVGCGAPKVSMGWFHLTQLMADERVQVSAIVEPWFLGAGAKAPGAAAFASLECPGAAKYAAMSDVPDGVAGAPRLFLIACRTLSAPTLFAEAIAKGATHIYLEKPGATSADELSAMRDLAA